MPEQSFESIEQLELMARDLIGDSGHPNIFFVSTNGMIVAAVSARDMADAVVSKLDVQTSILIEDRLTGVVWENATSERMQRSND